MSTAGRSHREWKRLCAWGKAELPSVCHICGDNIDQGIHYLDRWAWTLDHVESLDTHPHLAHDPANLRPAHRGCNSRKGNGSRKPPMPPASRQWT